MAYFEAAAVVYLQRALTIKPRALFPLLNQTFLGGLGSIEVGREFATMVMLVAVGWLVGKSGIESLAWTAVAFGVWDILYYFWLWIFIGWPTSFGSTDLLFLLPVPWVGPVWAPMVVSLALIFFGLVVAKRSRASEVIVVEIRTWALLILGALVVVLSFAHDAKRILGGGMPGSFAWPIFALGMAIAVYGASRITLRK